ncbi:MAG TPA: discoidin domain-containing protein [Cytophagales bacterium]|nr:discoidin domain-containing protein [Cytophagales bacterium]
MKNYYQIPIRAHHNFIYGKAILLLLLLITILPNLALAQCEQIVWQDEFNGPNLDNSKWGMETGGGGWGTGQLDYSTDRPENVRIVDGKLVLEIRKEDYQGHQYTSGRIRTYKKVDFQYGRIEARLKGVYSQGNGFAFWLLGSDFESVWWPKSGEVDIFENTGKYPGKNIGTAHYEESWGHAWNQGSYTLPNNQRWADDFHTAAIEWSPTYIKYFIDGILYHTFDISEPINGYRPFNRPFFIILSVGMGGSYSGPPDATTVSPMKAEIDWVRVSKGTYSTFISGDNKVYKGETFKDYSINVGAGNSVSWTVPAGATITSGQGTNAITVNWGQSGGEVKATVTSGCGTNTYSLDVIAEAPFVADKVFENFEVPPALTYFAMSGTLTKDVANPSPSVINNSSKVGKYVRNATEQYDYITLKGINAQPVGEFVYGKRKILLDVYTDAPVGTKVSLNFENGNVATGNNYPSGRYANFEAVTTKQNQWETLEFAYQSSPDIYGSAAEVNQWILLFAPVTNTGHTFHFDNLRTGQSGGTPAPVYTDMLQNFDGTDLLTKDFSNGPYTVQANPSKVAPNTSNTVAKYVRDAASSYDALVYKTTAITDAYHFKKGTHKIYMDVYTDAPVGTRLSLNFEISSLALPDNWPSGRHSNYEAVTTKQNQWETVAFTISSIPDKSASDGGVDKLVFLFNPVTNTSHTYHIDNIRIVSTAQREVWGPGNTWEDYDANHRLVLESTTGTYSPSITNPLPGGVNNSPTTKVAKYVRSNAQQWDLLIFKKGTATLDAKALKERRQKIAMDIYTDAPAGTAITIGIDASSIATSENYPAGRHSNYQGLTKEQNQWHTVYLTYSNSLDPGTPDELADNIAILFDPGNLTGNTYYIDNIRTLSLSQDPVLTSIELTPASATATVGQTVQFTAQAKDQNGNNMNVPITWTGANCPTGNTCSFSATTAGSFVLKATSGSISKEATITVNGTPSGNLALNKPVFASSTQSGLPVTNVNDGAVATRWGSEWSDPQWIYVDLQASYTITKVVLKWEAASGKSYDIQVSDNATNWSTIYSTTTGDGGTDEINLSEAGRYIRMNGKLRNTGYGYSLFEFEVYGNSSGPVLTSIVVTPSTASVTTGGSQQFTAQGKDQFGANFQATFTWSTTGGGTISSSGLFTANSIGSGFLIKATSGSVQGSATVSVTAAPTNNLALNKPIVASSNEFPASEANDGNTNTRWSSNFTDNEWIYVDLQSSYALNKVVLNWETASGKSYDIQVSGNGSTWSTIYSTTTGDGGIDDINLSGTGRYVRMLGKTRNTGYGYSLWEFEVYGSPSGARLGLAEEKGSIKVFPNPVSSVVNISGMESGIAKVTVYSNGVKVLTQKLEGKTQATVDFSTLSQGVYVIKVETKAGVITEKLIKK